MIVRSQKTAEAPCPAPDRARLVVFTDLDGTLIDFHTYSPRVALPAVRALLAGGDRLVFCSSKTLEEQLAIMEQIGIRVPAIVENGSAIFLPAEDPLRPPESVATQSIHGGTLAVLGTPANTIRTTLRSLEAELGIDLEGYGKLSEDVLMARTGLAPAAAARARRRAFSETLTAQLPPEDWARVDRHLQAAGLVRRFGGRFHTVTAAGCDKGRAARAFMDWLRAASRAAAQPPGADRWVSIGLGDSANDREMLASVEQPFLVQRPDGSWTDLDLPAVHRVPGVGPHGWVHAIRSLIEPPPRRPPTPPPNC